VNKTRRRKDEREEYREGGEVLYVHGGEIAIVSVERQGSI